jgi:hypothetical protein
VASAIRQAVFRSRCIRRRAQRATAYSRLIFAQHTQRLSVAQQQDQPGEPVGVRILEPNFRGRNRVGGNRAPNLVPALRPRFPSPSGAAPHPFWDPWHCASGVRTEPRASWLSVPSAVPSGQPSGLRSVARKDGTPQPSAIQGARPMQDSRTTEGKGAKWRTLFSPGHQSTPGRVAGAHARRRYGLDSHTPGRDRLSVRWPGRAESAGGPSASRAVRRAAATRSAPWGGCLRDAAPRGLT